MVWYLGTIVMEQYYVVYDMHDYHNEHLTVDKYNQIGIAKKN